jgi:hypothetical protein
MQKNYIALALAAAISTVSLGGCATDPTTGLPTISPTVLTSVEQDVQAGAAALCGFVPTIASVAGVVATFINGGTAVVNIATAATQAICNAVTAAPTTAPTASVIRGKRTMVRRLLTTPTVNGVAINGYFIR